MGWGWLSPVAVGLYGVTAYTVEQRTGEIRVRMALGANGGNVISMVLEGAFWQVGVGLALGIPAAIGAGWAMTTSCLGKFWIRAALPAAVLLALSALTAALIPARRAEALTRCARFERSEGRFNPVCFSQEKRLSAPFSLAT